LPEPGECGELLPSLKLAGLVSRQGRGPGLAHAKAGRLEKVRVEYQNDLEVDPEDVAARLA